MSSPAFISYSRVDSAFALRLAQDLRAAGVSVWLDQIDILAGERWDISIEEAVDRTERLIFILSPASVKSSNVRDEISLAIDEQKILLPVLLADCSIPLQLRRVQYIDFRGDYAPALESLVRQMLAPAHSQPVLADPAPVLEAHAAIPSATAASALPIVHAPANPGSPVFPVPPAPRRVFGLNLSLGSFFKPSLSLGVPLAAVLIAVSINRSPGKPPTDTADNTAVPPAELSVNAGGAKRPVAPTASLSQVPSSLDARDVTAIGQTLSAWKTALLANDPDTVASFYAPQVDRFYLQANFTPALVAAYINERRAAGDVLHAIDFSGVQLTPLTRDHVIAFLPEHFSALTNGLESISDTWTVLHFARQADNPTQWKITSERQFNSPEAAQKTIASRRP